MSFISFAINGGIFYGMTANGDIYQYYEPKKTWNLYILGPK